MKTAGGSADGRAMQGVQKGGGGIRGPGDVRVNKTDTPVSSTYRSQDGALTAEFPPALQHLCFSPHPLPHLPSPPLTPMSLFTHPLVCRERQHSTPPPPTAPTPLLHPDTPLLQLLYPPCPIPSIISLRDMRSEVHTFLFLLSSLSPGAF